LQADPNSTNQGHYLFTAGRLKPGISIDAARAQMKIRGEDFRKLDPRWMDDKESVAVVPMREATTGDVRTALLVLFGAVAHRSGALVLRLGDAVRLRPLVAQGCRPIGTSYIVTAAERNVIQSLAGMPPLERLRDLFAGLSPEDQERANRGLHIGLVINEYATEFGPGDFLIRNVIGADRNTGAVAVGDEVHVGQTVQFHIRDASAADEDLRSALGVLELSRAGDPNPLAGALMFTCNGRGSHLFGTPDHDIETVRRSIGQLPVAGMFCAGEIGQVGGRNFLHGFTASLALFVAPASASSPPR